MDRFGVWLSSRKLRHEIGDRSGCDVADLGCGYHAQLSRTLEPGAASLTLIDIAIADELKSLSKVTALEGSIPNVLRTLGTSSFDLILCISVLEHLPKPQEIVTEMNRLLRPGGVCIINVPTWLGKRFLEFSAFRLGLSPAQEMDDHKMYYNERDLWPILVAGGFKPRNIRCRRHKFGLNLFATCRVDPGGNL